MIYFSSDFHLGHDRDFVYKARGFSNIFDHDIAIIDNVNRVVKEEDELYILGDLMLNDNNWGMYLLNKIKCKHIHIVLGNHDSKTRINLYKTLFNVVEVKNEINNWEYGNFKFRLSHKPLITKMPLLNLYGHTHQKNWFYGNMYNMYNVGVDANNNKPVSIEDIIIRINNNILGGHTDD